MLLAISFMFVSCSNDDVEPYEYMTRTEEIFPGAECPNGGIRISEGADRNGNFYLDGSEVVKTFVVCN